MGRPRKTPESDELKAQLIEWVTSSKTPRNFCRQPGHPRIQTVYRWLDEDPYFAEEYRRAMRIGFDMLAQQILDIADMRDPQDIDDVKHRALRIKARLQLLAVWDPERYGNRVQVSGDPANPIRVMTDTEVMSQVMQILAVAKARQLQSESPNRLNGESHN